MLYRLCLQAHWYQSTRGLANRAYEHLFQAKVGRQRRPVMRVDEVAGNSASEAIDELERENAELRASLRRSRASSGRAAGAIVLVVIGSLVLPLAAGALWLRTSVLSPSDYVETVGPLASDPAVQQAAGSRVSETVIETIGLEELARDALPDDAAFLSSAIARGGEVLVEGVATDLIASDRFRTLWDEANRTAFTAVAELLAGRDEGALQTADGRVVVSLEGAAQQVLDTVAGDFDLDADALMGDEPLDAEIVLFESEELADLQGLARLVDRASWMTVLVALVAFAGAIALAPRRPRALVWVGVGMSVSMLLCLIGFSWAREIYEAGLVDAAVDRDAALAAFDVLSRFLHRILRALFVLGLVFVFIGWITGDGARAERARAAGERLFGRAVEATDERFALGPIPGWIASNAGVLQVATVGIAGLVIVWWHRPTGLVVLTIFVLCVASLGAIRAFGRLASE